VASRQDGGPAQVVMAGQQPGTESVMTHKVDYIDMSASTLVELVRFSRLEVIVGKRMR